MPESAPQKLLTTPSPAKLTDDQISNVGLLLSRAAAKWPDHPAIAEPCRKSSSGWKQLTFAELEVDTNRIAQGLIANGVRPGQRLAMLVPPGIDFVSMVFALLKTGAVIILIDPGIGRSNLVKCLSDSKPEGVVGIAKAQIARLVFRKRLPQAKNNFVVGRRYWPGCTSIDSFRQDSRFSSECKINTRSVDDDAAIIFTSGSTGPPKGVGYSHRNFITQAIEIRDYFEIESGGADISGFPLFALFNSAMGVTTVFPKMDFTRPADVSPSVFVKAADDWQATQSFGSPALWNTVSRWCEDHGKTMPTIKRAFSAGAPVPAHVLKRVRKVIAADGEMFTPYGATESLPVACNSASIVLSETAEKTSQGAGVCVGSRFRRMNWKVIQITDEPIATIDDIVEVARGEVGELIVNGPVVTKAYVTRTDANPLAKIQDGDQVWHRMGDLGYLDEHDRFWFCGRKSQRLVTSNGTMFTVPCESIINSHPAIYRSALVGVRKGEETIPVLVAEPWPEHWPATDERAKRLLNELLNLRLRHESTFWIRHISLQKSLPVDIRHNSKIFREQISIDQTKQFKANGWTDLPPDHTQARTEK